MELEVKSAVRGGVGNVTFQYFFKKDEITARTRLCARLILPPGARVRDLMAKVERKNFEGMGGKDSPLSLQDMGQDDLLLILNGRPIQNLRGYDTPLEDGDILAVFPVMAGG